MISVYTLYEAVINRRVLKVKTIVNRAQRENVKRAEARAKKKHEVFMASKGGRVRPLSKEDQAVLALPDIRMIPKGNMSKVQDNVAASKKDFKRLVKDVRKSSSKKFQSFKKQVMDKQAEDRIVNSVHPKFRKKENFPDLVLKQSKKKSTIPVPKPKFQRAPEEKISSYVKDKLDAHKAVVPREKQPPRPDRNGITKTKPTKKFNLRKAKPQALPFRVPRKPSTEKESLRRSLGKSVRALLDKDKD